MANETNYIKRLQNDNADLKAKLDAAMEEVKLFRAHLQSSKFYEDTTIQVKDVDARLLNLTSLLMY